MNCSDSTKFASLVIILILSLIGFVLLFVFRPGTKVVTIEQKEFETYIMENNRDLVLFKPKRNVSITLSKDGLYHISFSITLNCEIMNHKEIFITHHAEKNKTSEILMQKNMCGQYKSSCFEQKLFLAKEFDSVLLKSECRLNKYAGNFLTLAYVKD